MEKQETQARPAPTPPIDLRQSASDVQTPDEGTGPLFYRRYEIQIALPEVRATDLMRAIQADPNLFAPPELAHYRKTKGELGFMQRDDEFLIELTGPWNGPVRVVACDPLSFTLATLRDHMEAGAIRFSLEDEDQELHFGIDSWARSADALVDLAYDKLGVARAVQKEMWTSFCERVCKASGGAQMGPVRVHTERIKAEATPSAR